jgi:hypothetical protein
MFTLRELVSNFAFAIGGGGVGSDPRLLIDRTVAPTIWEDEITALIDAEFDCIYRELVDKITLARKIGRETECYYEEIAYLQALNVWFVELKRTLIDCASLDKITEAKEDFKLECIRESLNCKYGRGKLMDDIEELLGLNEPLIGIDYMAIDDDSCQVFKID